MLVLNTYEKSDFTGMSARPVVLMIFKFKIMPSLIAGGDPNRIADNMRIGLHSDHSCNP